MSEGKSTSLELLDDLLKSVAVSSEAEAELPAVGKGHAVDDHGLKGKKMEGKCMCEMCREGLATTHNDETHDQSLFGHFELAATGLTLDLIGGSTKCGRVMSDYFATVCGSVHPNEFTNSRILEVGSGTGIVGISLAFLMGDDVAVSRSAEDSLETMATTDASSDKSVVSEECESAHLVSSSKSKLRKGPGLVCMTDQSYVLEVLEENCNENLYFKHDSVRRRISVRELVWSKENALAFKRWPPIASPMADLSATDTAALGDEWLPTEASEERDWDYLVGSDLIYALEGIRPLVDTLHTLATARTVVFIAVIRRFKWEELFFELMQERFTQELALLKGDIAIYKYTRPSPAS